MNLDSRSGASGTAAPLASSPGADSLLGEDDDAHLDSSPTDGGLLDLDDDEAHPASSPADGLLAAAVVDDAAAADDDESDDADAGLDAAN
jgi:hypothetical protein